MSTVSTKHVLRVSGDPPMTYTHGSTLLDDMEVIRRLCLPEKHDPSMSNASHISFGKPDGTAKTCHQLDYVDPGLATRDPKSLRDARSRYMNDPHFRYGYDRGQPVSEHQAAFKAPTREQTMRRPPGGHGDKNRSTMKASPADRAAWADDLETTHRVDYLHPGVGDARQNSDDRKNDHRSTHYILGSDPLSYKTLASEEYAAPAGFVRQEPVKAPPCGVQLGSKDYPWHKDLASTYQFKFAPHLPGECDALTEFMQKGPPIQFGDDKREMLTENCGAYKKIEYLDCSKLTNEQLTLLGVTREQIIPRKVPLPFVGSQLFQNSLGHTFGEQF